RSIFDDVGLFDESLPACEDYDLWLRITSVYPVLYCDEPLIQKYGGHEDQLSRKHWGMDRFRIQALVGILEAGGLNESDYAAALEMMLGKAKVVLGGARKRNNDDVIAAYEALIARWR
ncbi:Glycosyl transferase, family 2, partial [hydrothermal vent metagenome]